MPEPHAHAVVESPVGELLLVSDGEALRGIHMPAGREPALAGRRDRAARPFPEARRQLAEYFAGERLDFDLPLAMTATDFQRCVWRALRELPYGTTLAYGELARRIGRPAASRAVGAANGRNPLSIVVPCHRVVGAGGALTGYAGGLARKRLLIDHEANALARRRAAGDATAGRGRYVLLGADGRPYESARPGTLGGHRRNRVYGRLDCAGALRWIAKGHYVAHRVFFADEDTAIAAGYRPCARCMPDRYRRWAQDRQ